MLVLHVYVMGKNGAIEKCYDFMKNDGKDGLEGCDIVIPYSDDHDYPLTESAATAIISNKDIRGDH